VGRRPCERGKVCFGRGGRQCSNGKPAIGAGSSRSDDIRLFFDRRDPSAQPRRVSLCKTLDLCSETLISFRKTSGKADGVRRLSQSPDRPEKRAGREEGGRLRGCGMIIVRVHDSYSSPVAHGAPVFFSQTRAYNRDQFLKKTGGG
jgi:hypothetical protein